MMEHISIFNYEAFYLDFLEGNLSEEERAAFLAFLDKHPLLREELDVLDATVLVPDEASMRDKNKLKKADFVEDRIDEHNVEQFLIAEIEHLLSPDRLDELAAFLKIPQHHKYQVERSLYAKTKNIPNKELHFPNKEKLKRRAAIVWWNYAVAASILLMLGMVFWKISTENQIVEDNTPRYSKQDKDNSLNSLPKDTVLIVPDQQPIQEIQTAKRTKQAPKSVKRPTKELQHEAALKINQLPMRVTQLESIANADELKPVNLLIHEAENPVNDDLTMAQVILKNPVEPITKRISNATNTVIDYRTAKPSDNERRKFQLRIGKFEISRK